jgi:hypothetical protein
MLRVLAVHRLLQQGNDRAHALVLLPPRGEDVDANKRERRRDTDERPLRLSFFFARPLGAAALSRD